MSWLKRILASGALVGTFLLGAMLSSGVLPPLTAIAEAACSTVYPFSTGCPLPAAGLNAAFLARMLTDFSNAVGVGGDLSGSLPNPTVSKVRGDANVAFLDVQDQSLTGGANVTSQTQTAGNITVDCGKNPAQYIANTAAFTITAPANDGYCFLDIENGVGAGAVSVSGFSPNSIGGATLDTTNGHNFRLYVSRVHGHATIDAKALQ